MTDTIQIGEFKIIEYEDGLLIIKNDGESSR